jgi:hypothetical protein
MLQAKEKQIQRVRTIFHRQLSVPLVNMRSTLKAYKAWEMEQGNVLDVESGDLDGISSQVASAYQRALEGYNARVNLEEQISRQDISEAERLQQFMVYSIQNQHFTSSCNKVLSSLEIIFYCFFSLQSFHCFKYP